MTARRLDAWERRGGVKPLYGSRMQTVAVQFPMGTLDEIDQIAWVQNRSVSAVIRELVSEALSARQTPGPGESRGS